MRMYLNLDMRFYYCRWFHVVALPRREDLRSKNWGLEDDFPVSSCLPGRIYVKFRDLHQQPSGPNASNTSNASNETTMPEAGSNKKYLKDVLRKLVLVFFFCFFFWVSQDGSLGTLRQIMPYQLFACRWTLAPPMPWRSFLPTKRTSSSSRRLSTVSIRNRSGCTRLGCM